MRCRSVLFARMSFFKFSRGIDPQIFHRLQGETRKFDNQSNLSLSFDEASLLSHIDFDQHLQTTIGTTTLPPLTKQRLRCFSL